MPERLLRIDEIDLGGGTQSRRAINQTHIEDLADALLAGDDLPPPEVFFDGEKYWCADGHHTVLAHRKADRDRVRCNVHNGTLEDALWASYHANIKHGLKRTPNDKAKVVRAALAHPNAKGMSAREVARHCGVDHKTVAQYMNKPDLPPPDGVGAPGEFPTNPIFQVCDPPQEEVENPPEQNDGGIEPPGEFPTNPIFKGNDTTQQTPRKRGRPTREEAARRANSKRGTPLWVKVDTALGVCTRGFDKLGIQNDQTLAAFKSLHLALENC